MTLTAYILIAIVSVFAVAVYGLTAVAFLRS